jgi:hypothetical protein
VNFVTLCADNRDVHRAPDDYFVRIGSRLAAPAPEHPGRTGHTRAEHLPAPPEPRRPHRRKRTSLRTKLLAVCAVSLGAWFAWASGQPGGVSGVLNGFVEDVRGDVGSVGSGPSLRHASRFMNGQYRELGRYPILTDDQLAAAGIGIDVDIVDCGGQAVVLQTLTASRLLLTGEDRGDVVGRIGCPEDLRDPAPWKLG